MGFIRQYLSVALKDITAVTAFVQQNYTAQVLYYGKLSTPSDVIRDKDRYIKQWPVRSSELQGNSELSCDPATLTYDFTGRNRWSTSRPGALTKSGLAVINLGIVVQPSGGFRIAREISTVVERYPDSSP